MVLGFYRETGRSITDNKKEQLIVENAEHDRSMREVSRRH